MQKILQSYQRRLTNLSSNNRSLLLLRLISDQFIDVHRFNFLLKEPSFKIIHQLIAGKRSIRISHSIDPRDSDSNERLLSAIKSILSGGIVSSIASNCSLNLMPTSFRSAGTRSTRCGPSSRWLPAPRSWHRGRSRNAIAAS